MSNRFDSLLCTIFARLPQFGCRFTSTVNSLLRSLSRIRFTKAFNDLLQGDIKTYKMLSYRRETALQGAL